MKFKPSGVGSRYGKVLTVIITIATTALVVLIGIWFYTEYEQYKIEHEAEKAIEEFLEEINVVVLEDEIVEASDEVVEDDNMEQTQPQKKTSSSSSKKTSSTSAKKVVIPKTYKGFTMQGYIQIPRTGIKLPLLESVSAAALEKSVGILMGPGLNQPGNTVILGHNYRNRTLFSRNSRIQIGDQIYITDSSGEKYAYTVYDKFVTSPDDGLYMTRNTNGAIEISLSTCTDDNANRLIICARVE